ncbi:hypothetical protein R6Q59_025908 [Mikania micrantha]|uniref:DUF3741 domain-containing protein n=1 Tax=Mikania micrantha TaxID=192012 RepID=A0A5N6PCX8_9ASTR|nr:hypothetical protein E3N88_11154 [Mikania micrantha]
MKFFQSSSSETQLSKLKSTRNCLPGVLCHLPCFLGRAHSHINDLTGPVYAKTDPGIVAKLMGLDSIPQRIPLVHHHGNLNTKSQPTRQTPMVLEIKKGKFFVIGFETECKGKRKSRSDSKRKLEAEEVESKKKKLVTETSKSNRVLKEAENDDFELGFLDQLVLELVYVF